jgi:hypothetical protein
MPRDRSDLKDREARRAERQPHVVEHNKNHSLHHLTLLSTFAPHHSSHGLPVEVRRERWLPP